MNFSLHVCDLFQNRTSVDHKSVVHKLTMHDIFFRLGGHINLRYEFQNHSCTDYRSTINNGATFKLFYTILYI